MIGLILNFGAALVGLGGPEGEVAEAVLHIVHSSMEAARLASGKPPDIEAEVYKLENELQAWNTRAMDANVCLRQAFHEHWGLLKAMGEPIVANDLDWPSTLTRTLVDSAQREYEIGLYKTLTPVKWWVIASISEDTEDPCTNEFNDPPGALFAPYPSDLSGYGLWYWRPEWAHWNRTPWGSGLIIVDNNCDKAPPQEAMRTVFLEPEADGTGALGVPLKDPYCAYNGWGLLGSGRAHPVLRAP